MFWEGVDVVNVSHTEAGLPAGHPKRNLWESMAVSKAAKALLLFLVLSEIVLMSSNSAQSWNIRHKEILLLYAVPGWR